MFAQVRSLVFISGGAQVCMGNPGTLACGILTSTSSWCRLVPEVILGELFTAGAGVSAQCSVPTQAS
jgi:hypothetical protein